MSKQKTLPGRIGAAVRVRNVLWTRDDIGWVSAGYGRYSSRAMACTDFEVVDG